MLAYPCRFEPEEEGGFTATCRDMPGCVTFGATLDEAKAMAADAIATLLSDAKGPQAWPLPTDPKLGEVVVDLPPGLAAKATLWALMNEQGLSKSGLARRFGCDEREVRRLLSFRHRSQFDRLESALRTLGKELAVEVRDAA